MKIVLLFFKHVFKDRKGLLILLLIGIAFGIYCAFGRFNLLNMGGDILSGLSIFIGVLFSLLLLIYDRAKTYKERVNSGTSDNSEKNIFMSYLNFSKALILEISFTIVTSVGLILSILLGETDNIFPKEYQDLVYQINIFFITSLAAFQFILVLDVLKQMFEYFISNLDTKNRNN